MGSVRWSTNFPGGVAELRHLGCLAGQFSHDRATGKQLCICWRDQLLGELSDLCALALG